MTKDRGVSKSKAAVESISVFIVSGSGLEQSATGALLKDDRELSVVGWAPTAERSVPAITRLAPDVIAVESDLPLAEFHHLTRRILLEAPTPIVGVVVRPGHYDEGASRQLIDSGVLSVVKAWRQDPAQEDAADLIRRTLKSMSQVKVIRRWAPPSSTRSVAAPGPIEPSQWWHDGIEVVAIGASTGGPQALQEVLAMLPATFVPPILVVQHMTPGFLMSMAGWLQSSCPLPVQLAGHGVLLDRPGIYIAPSGSHMTVRGHRLALSNSPPIHGHRPSATALFESVGRDYGAAAAGILLTGMGDDGATGLGVMKRAGALTMAQNEATSVVFGMPAVAIGLGYADQILSPNDIGAMLLTAAGAKS